MSHSGRARGETADLKAVSLISLRRCLSRSSSTPGSSSNAARGGRLRALLRPTRGNLAIASLAVFAPVVLAVSTLAIGASASPWNRAPSSNEVDFTQADLNAAAVEPTATPTVVVEPTAEATEAIAIATETPRPQATAEPTVAAALPTTVPATSPTARPAVVEPTTVPATSPTAKPAVVEPTAVPTQLAPVQAAPRAAVTSIALPQGYSVYISTNGCLASGICPFGTVPANYYWAPTSTAVLYPGQPAWTLQHEACHAHQHLTIEQELGISPAMPYDLHEWLSTSEARIWNATVTTAWPATGQWAVEPGAHTAIEDFGISCGLYLTAPAQLQQIDPARYAAIDAILR